MGTVSGEFATWMRIKLGTHENSVKLRQEIIDRGYNIMPRADFLLCRKTKVSSSPREVDLVRTTVGELGFDEDTQRRFVMQRAIQRGLALCPAEVGPQLRLQLGEQSLDERLHIAMDPLDGPDGRPCTYDVDDAPWGLDEGYAVPDGWWPPNATFVFCRQ